MLAWRDISVRYKQTLIGALWAVIRPFLTMIVFTVVFSRVANLPTEGSAPYAVMVFAGMLPWFLFAGVMSDGSQSLVTNGPLVGKVYFPRILIPVSTSAVHIVDFLVSLVVLLGLCVWFSFVPSLKIILLPAFFVLALVTALGPALLMSAWNIKYRDFRYIIPFIVQFGIYISPVGFSSSVVPENLRFFFYLNPMAGVIDGFRWALIPDARDLAIQSMGLSTGVAIFVLGLGIRVFRRSERSFADVI
jgi:lipopolysaccharide transport system permease protein